MIHFVQMWRKSSVFEGKSSCCNMRFLHFWIYRPIDFFWLKTDSQSRSQRSRQLSNTTIVLELKMPERGILFVLGVTWQFNLWFHRHKFTQMCLNPNKVLHLPVASSCEYLEKIYITVKIFNIWWRETIKYWHGVC